MTWRLVSFAFALVALGHAFYIGGGLAPVQTAAYFDALTVLVVGAAAWFFARDDRLSAMPRVVWGGFVALALIKAFDFATSLSDGFYFYHVGFVPIVVGTILLAARRMRLGAALNAFGSAVYFLLEVGNLMSDPASFNLGYFAGSLTAAAGWLVLAGASWFVPVESATPSQGSA